MKKNNILRSVTPSEHQIQCAIVEWARVTDLNIGKVHKAKVGDYLIKNANEGKRSFFVGKQMKKEGLTAGVSDLFFAFPKNIGNYNMLGEPCGGLWIEVKSKKGRITSSQKIWIERMAEVGYEAKVVRGVDEGIQAIKDYLGMR